MVDVRIQRSFYLFCVWRFSYGCMVMYSLVGVLHRACVIVRCILKIMGSSKSRLNNIFFFVYLLCAMK